jgi:hypothetical protein
MKIVGFYFVALIFDNWDKIVNEQITKILNSDLFKITNELNIRVYYEKEKDFLEFKNFLKNQPKIKITSTTSNEHEYGILQLIEDKSNIDNFYCYYLHSKGVSITPNTMKKHKLDISFEQMTNSIESWRRYMEYFLIDRYKECIEILDNGFDGCGVQLRGTPRKNTLHFSGNFWWSKSEYIKKLPKLETFDKENRNEPEFWIGYGYGNFKNLYFTKQAGYQTIISENYKQTSIKTK